MQVLVLLVVLVSSFFHSSCISSLIVRLGGETRIYLTFPFKGHHSKNIDVYEYKLNSMVKRYSWGHML